MAIIKLNNQSLSAVTTLPAADGSSLTGISAGGASECSFSIYRLQATGGGVNGAPERTDFIGI